MVPSLGWPNHGTTVAAIPVVHICCLMSSEHSISDASAASFLVGPDSAWLPPVVHVLAVGLDLSVSPDLTQCTWAFVLCIRIFDK